MTYNPKHGLIASLNAKARYRRERLYGLNGWSTTDRLEQSTSSPMQGDGTGSQFVRTALIYYISGSNLSIFEHQEKDLNKGWWLFIDANLRVHFRVYDGSFHSDAFSAALTSNRAYAIYAGYNGTNLFMDVNGSNYTSTGSGFAPSADVAAVGAGSTKYSGAFPASGCWIAGVAASDSASVLGISGRAAYTAECISANDIMPFANVEYMYSSKKGDMSKDLVSNADWSVVGSPNRSSVVPVYG